MWHSIRTPLEKLLHLTFQITFTYKINSNVLLEIEKMHIIYFFRKIQFISFSSLSLQLPFKLNANCKVEINQPSYWLYSVPNLLVFYQLVIMYLGENHVRVVCERVWRNAQDCAKKQGLATGSHEWLAACKPPEVAHVPSMPEVEASCQLEHYSTKSTDWPFSYLAVETRKFVKPPASSVLKNLTLCIPFSP